MAELQASSLFWDHLNVGGLVVIGIFGTMGYFLYKNWFPYDMEKEIKRNVEIKSKRN
jgi:hypothetical protein